MTRVALLGPSRHPVAEPFAGGQESHVATLSRALRRRGHHVVLHAAPGSDPSLADELVTHPRLPELSAVSAVDPNLPEPGFLRDQHAFLAVVGDMMQRRDVDVVDITWSLPRNVSAPQRLCHAIAAGLPTALDHCVFQSSR